MIELDDEGIRKARITQFLILLNIITFVMVYLFSQEDEYFLLLAQINRRVIFHLEVWRIFTSIFVHQTWFHLISNIIILYLYGSLIERNYKKHEYILIYLISGIVGNLFTLILFPLDTVSVGASGAIFGLIGAAFALVGRNNDRVILILSLLYLIYFFVVGFQPGINIWAHFFGLLGGAMIGYLFLKYRYEVINGDENGGAYTDENKQDSSQDELIKYE